MPLFSHIFLKRKKADTDCFAFLACLTGRGISSFTCFPLAPPLLYTFLQNPLKWEFPTPEIRSPKKQNKVPDLISLPRRYQMGRFRICFRISFLKGAGLPGNRLQKIIFCKNVFFFRISYENSKLFYFRKPPFPHVSPHNQLYKISKIMMRHQGVASLQFFVYQIPAVSENATFAFWA